MNPEHLRSFLAVCDHRSFTRAAQARFLTQPAISRQIQQLERQLGTPLFVRSGREARLNEAGRALRPLAEELLARMQRVADDVRLASGMPARRLRLGASTAPGRRLVPAAIGRVRALRPDLELDFVVDNSREVERAVARDDLDLGFVGGRIAGAALDAEPVAEDEVIGVCAPDHRLARRTFVPPADLARETWIVREEGSATRRLVEDWAASSRASPRRRLEARSPEAVKALVQAGMGVAFLSIESVRLDLAAGALHRLPVEGLRLVRPILLVRRSDAPAPWAGVFAATARGLAHVPRARCRGRGTAPPAG